MRLVAPFAFSDPTRKTISPQRTRSTRRFHRETMREKQKQLTTENTKNTEKRKIERWGVGATYMSPWQSTHSRTSGVGAAACCALVETSTILINWQNRSC